eukprot:scaffold16.g135.t1
MDSSLELDQARETALARKDFASLRAYLRLAREHRVRDPESVAVLGAELLRSHARKLAQEELWSVHEQVIVAALDLGNSDLANSLIKNVNRKFPESSRAARLSGIFVEHAGQLDKAAELYGKELEANPQNVAMLKRVVAMKKGQGDLTGAVEALRSYLDVQQGDWMAWEEAADAYLQMQVSVHLLYADTLYTMGGVQHWRTARSYYSGEQATMHRGVIEMTEGADLRALYGVCACAAQLAGARGGRGAGPDDDAGLPKLAAEALLQANPWDCASIGVEAQAKEGVEGRSSQGAGGRRGRASGGAAGDAGGVALMEALDAPGAALFREHLRKVRAMPPDALSNDGCAFLSAVALLEEAGAALPAQGDALGAGAAGADEQWVAILKYLTVAWGTNDWQPHQLALGVPSSDQLFPQLSPLLEFSLHPTNGRLIFSPGEEATLLAPRAVVRDARLLTKLLLWADCCVRSGRLAGAGAALASPRASLDDADACAAIDAGLATLRGRAPAPRHGWRIPDARGLRVLALTIGLALNARPGPAFEQRLHDLMELNELRPAGPAAAHCSEQRASQWGAMAATCPTAKCPPARAAELLAEGEAALAAARPFLPYPWLREVQTARELAQAVRPQLELHLAHASPDAWRDDLQAAKRVNPSLAIDDSLTCAGCGHGALALLRCGGCRRAFYCSKDCQARHWAEHKPQCLAWRREREQAGSGEGEEEEAEAAEAEGAAGAARGLGCCIT